MRFTFSDLQTDFLQKTGNAGSTDSALLDFFKRNLTARYQMAFSEITNQTTQQVKTASTAVNQQYYHLPAGVLDVEDVTVTVGAIAYPLITVDSQLQWDRVNQILLSTTALPQFIFPRRDDFGIWPIPQGVYTITFNYHIRDRSLTTTDYTTGTVATTINSTLVTGSGGATFTAAMKNRWFIMNDPTQDGQGYWYRITSVPTSSTLTLETSYEQPSVSGATYRIGESPELPEETHVLLSTGVASDYYAGPRSDMTKATWFNNVYWTGDGQNSKRDDVYFTGGILGAKQRFSGRNDGAIVNKHGLNSSWTERMWASSIT